MADVRLIGPPEADGEYLGFRQEASTQEEVVHLHDYPRLYAVSGLYEHVVQELLGCRSPQVAADGLARAVRRLDLDPLRLRVLDLGAGTGLVGELLREGSFSDVIGLDALPQARAACLRDRPGVYRDYVVGDLADPSAEPSATLRGRRPGALIAAGAFGGTHAPPRALSNALALLPRGAPVVFTIDRRWLHTNDPGGFRSALSRLLDSGELSLLERTSFQHRVTTTGTPIHYELIVAVTGPEA
ncbi:MAG TPA: class I SAM-dependent methyltransferase [Solirubrobacteraceae bacterium]|nr:class I SAM-dependent methyltransferase [Solirubrobacteraceae bacterium]